MCIVHWKLRPFVVVLLGLLFVPLDVAFCFSSAVKVFSGGWVIIVISLVIYFLVRTWRKGKHLLRAGEEGQSIDQDAFLAEVREQKPQRVRGTAVFLSRNPAGVPRSLLHNYKHNHVLHASTVLLTVETVDVPTVPEAERVSASTLGEGFHRVIVRYGFSETPAVVRVLDRLELPGVSFAHSHTTYFLGKESLVLRHDRRMSFWAKRVFAVLSRNALDAWAFFGLPPGRVVELGAQQQL
jgi:KUP system potassium uptake protein